MHMSTSVNDPEEEDVYSANTYIGAASTNKLEGHCSIRVTAENSPLTLSRIYGLLATLTIVPSASRSTIMSVDELAVTLDFRDVSYSSIDRLCRKLAQITEIASVSTLPIDCP
jgi:hypothetical protein